MMIGRKTTVAILGATLLIAACAAETNARPTELSALGLTCEYAVDPLGIDVAAPRFSWVLESTRRGQAQSAYRILVAGSEAKLAANNGDKWDSGRIVSVILKPVAYKGKTLFAFGLEH